MNLVKGTEFEALLPIFIGIYPNMKFSHNVNVKGVIVKESYGTVVGQHTFTFTVLYSSDKNYIVGKNYLKKGRNLYPYIIDYKVPIDYDIQALDKKERALKNSIKYK